MGHSAKRLKRGTPLGEEEQAEARQLLDRLGATVRAAAAVFMTEDARTARQLVAEKEAFRDQETAATRAHFAGLRGGPVDPASLDLDLMRELKRVNGHLIAPAVYPILEGQGELLASRLRLDL
jgi:phosphate:Na+ symporter